LDTGEGFKANGWRTAPHLTVVELELLSLNIKNRDVSLFVLLHLTVTPGIGKLKERGGRP